MLILSAHFVLPIAGPPLEWGAVGVEGDRIVTVGLARHLLRDHPSAAHLDLRNAILLPGFVNAHAHLDYSKMRAVVPGLSLPNWIIELTRRKQACSEEYFLRSVRHGAAECLHAGITTVADCSDTALAAQALHETGLRGIAYPEVFGIDERDPLETSLARLAEKEERQRPWLSDRVRPGISPHAPYSVRAALFESLNTRALDEGLPLMIHLAEAREEVRMLLGENQWKSPIREGMVRYTPPMARPVPYLDGLGLLRPGVTFIHCVQVTHAEVTRLAESGAGIVTCPRSNAFLGVGIAPVRAMLDARMRLGLGTDGACSSGPLSMFEEMRAGWFIHRSVGATVTTRELVEMATLGGARALHREDEFGSLEPGKLADLCAVSLSDGVMSGCDDPFDALVMCGSAETVLFTMIGGKALWDPHGLFTGPCAAYSPQSSQPP